MCLIERRTIEGTITKDTYKTTNLLITLQLRVNYAK